MPLVTPLNAKLQDLARTLSSASDAELADIGATRRGLILAPLLAALPAALLADPAHAVDPTETQITLPDQMQWKPELSSTPPILSTRSASLSARSDVVAPYSGLSVSMT